MNLPVCAAIGCDNIADPRWFAHDVFGKVVMICDGHEGTPCNATSLKECTCPAIDNGKRQFEVAK